MVERCGAVVKAKLFEMRHRTDTMGFDEIARAVIEALMEPTPAMRVAGAHVHDQRPSEAAAVFQAMLRTALSQPNEEGEGK